MRQIYRIGLVVGLVVVMLLSMGGVVLASLAYDEIDGCDIMTTHVHIHEASLYQQFVNDSDPSGGVKDITQWHFVINQWSQADKPVDITVVWNNGSTSVIELSKETKKVAHYEYEGSADGTGLPPGSYVTKYTWVDTSAFPEWQDGTGNFNLSDITCNNPIPPIPELPPVALLGIGLLGLLIYMGLKRRKIFLNAVQ